MDVNLEQKDYYKLANLLPRSLAYIIDGITALAVSFILLLVFQGLTGKSQNLNILDNDSSINLLSGLILIIYSVVLIHLRSATLGKMVFHIKVVNTDYGRLSFTQVLKREILGKFLSNFLFGLGFIWAIIDERKQGWHDKIAKAYVISEQPVTYGEYLRIQENKKSNLPFVLISGGLLELILPSIIIFGIIPKLVSISSELGVSTYNAYLSYGLFGAILTFCMVQVVYGIALFNAQKKSGTISEPQKKIGKIFLVFGIFSIFLMTPIMVFTIILPIYKLTESF